MKMNRASRSAAWICGIAGLVAYNWWVLVPFKPGLMRSPNELFSNLEVTGQPYAVAMQRADVAAGVLLVGAFVLAGSHIRRREWLSVVVFALAGAVSGLFPQVCADGISAHCLSAERHFQLPFTQYIHDGMGLVEYAGITLALWLAYRRTRGDRTLTALGYRALAAAAAIAYPILGASYLFNVWGGVMEGLFFTGFTVMVLLQLAERLRDRDASLRPAELSPDHKHGMMRSGSAEERSATATAEP
jgi:hypothetical protein